MTDEPPRLSDIGQRMTPAWDEARATRVRLGVDRIRKQQRRRRRGMMAASLTVVVVCVAFVVSRRSTVSTHHLDGFDMQRLSDGTRVLGLSESTRLRVDQREDIVEVTMEAGAADFDVPEDRQPWRPYRVRAHEVVVDVVGTRFTVAHQPPSTVRVRVVSGRVQVHSPDERVELTAGEHRQFPEPEPEVSVSASEPPPPKKRVSRRRAKTRLAQKNEPRPTWQALAEQGRFEEAARSLSRGGRVETVEELLLAADAMRLTRQPGRAIEYLDRVTRDFPADRRVPLALFTKARLVAVTDPRRAARTFAKVYAHPKAGALAEDALAREVESWSKLGDKTRARARAELYLHRYPRGYRARAVRAFAGLE